MLMHKKRVFVSGCFDMLHSGHVRFLEEAASHGDVYVALGSDRTVRELKGRAPVTSQSERKYMLEALKHVKACFISSTSAELSSTNKMVLFAVLMRMVPAGFLIAAAAGINRGRLEDVAGSATRLPGMGDAGVG